MSLKKTGLAFFAMAVLGAAFASNAFALRAVTPTTAEWYVGPSPGTTLAKGSSLAATCSIGEHPTGEKKFVLVSNVKGTNVKITATGVECPGAKIENKEEGGGIMAVGSATSIKFTGVTVSEPSKCTTTSTLTTSPIVVKVNMEEKSTTKAFVKFEPAPGSTFFVKVPLLGSTCPIALEEGYEVKGFAYGEAVNPTGTFSKTQPVTFSEEIQKTAEPEGSHGLLFGKEPAYLTGRANFNFEKEVAVKG